MSYKIRPLNRRILIEPKKESDENTHGVLLPDEFKKRDEFVTVQVLERAPDCTLPALGREVIVQSSMIEEIKVQSNTYYMVLENYVLGSLRR